eukprot:4284862-Alexandrium_andersonii.AAC.1
MQPPPPPAPPSDVGGAQPQAGPPGVPQHPAYGRNAHFDVWRTEPEAKIVITVPLINRMQDVFFAACAQLGNDPRYCAMLSGDHSPVDMNAIVYHVHGHLPQPLWIVPMLSAGADSVRGGGRRPASPPAPEQARKAPRYDPPQSAAAPTRPQQAPSSS